jgi:hypothetical protein
LFGEGDIGESGLNGGPKKGETPPRDRTQTYPIQDQGESGMTLLPHITPEKREKMGDYYLIRERRG